MAGERGVTYDPKNPTGKADKAQNTDALTKTDQGNMMEKDTKKVQEAFVSG